MYLHVLRTVTAPGHSKVASTPRVLGILIVMAMLGPVSCARVKPYERGRLAQPDMQFDGSADLLAGQRHATDYREGSSGGFGGGGGGCGCN